MCDHPVCCLLVLDSGTSTLQWIREPEPRGCIHDPYVGKSYGKNSPTLSVAFKNGATECGGLYYYIFSVSASQSLDFIFPDLESIFLGLRPYGPYCISGFWDFRICGPPSHDTNGFSDPLVTGSDGLRGPPDPLGFLWASDSSGV